jgi:hypothetical protein
MTPGFSIAARQLFRHAAHFVGDCAGVLNLVHRFQQGRLEKGIATECEKCGVDG